MTKRELIEALEASSLLDKADVRFDVDSLLVQGFRYVRICLVTPEEPEAFIILGEQR